MLLALLWQHCYSNVRDGQNLVCKRVDAYFFVVCLISYLPKDRLAYPQGDTLRRSLFVRIAVHTLFYSV